MVRLLKMHHFIPVEKKIKKKQKQNSLPPYFAEIR